METKEKKRRILKSLRKCKKVKQEPFTGILQAIKEHTKEEAVYAMGDFGRRLRNFARNVDLSHPDLANIYDGQLVGGEYGTDLIDHLKLASYGKQWGLSEGVLKNLKRTITSHPVHKALKDNMESPTMNMLHVRFIPERVHRNTCRAVKDAQSVNLSYKRCDWLNQPDNFDNFWYGKHFYQEDIKESEKRVKRFVDNGLTSMAREIKRSIEEMEKKSLDCQYMGFNRISLVVASVILGKTMGYVYETKTNPWDTYNESQVNCYIPDGLFEGRSKVYYVPRIYPYRDFYGWASDEMKSLIDFLEEYPPLAGCALFDHYRILAPGGNWYADTSDEQKKIDQTLIQNGEMEAVLLGERDGDHYLISYWM